MPSNVLKCKRNRDFGAGETFGADNLMNPIWSFEVGVELEYEVRRPGTIENWQALFAQDGSSRERDGIPMLRANGSIGPKIAGYMGVVDVNGNVIASRGPEYPPTEVQVVLHRQSDDENSEYYNLYAPEGNSPVIFSDRPLAEMVDVPAGAIVLQDDPEIFVFRTCTTADAVCTDTLEFKVLEEIEQQFSSLQEVEYKRPLILARIAVDIGIGCKTDIATFGNGSFAQCNEIIVDWFDSENPDPKQRHENFIIPWAIADQNGVVKTTDSSGGNVVRFRLAGFESAEQLSYTEVISQLEFPASFEVVRQYTDEVDTTEVREVVTATMLPSILANKRRMFVSQTEADAELQRLFDDELLDNPKARPGNSNPLSTGQFQFDDFRPAWPGEPFAVYQFSGRARESGAELPPAYSSSRGKQEASEPYVIPSFTIDMAIKPESFVGPVIDVPVQVDEPEEFELVTGFRQTVASTIVQEYWDHYPYRSGGTAGKRINCYSTKKGGTPNADGTCDLHYPMPTQNTIIGIEQANAFTANYTEVQSNLANCSSSFGEGFIGCGKILFGNHYTRSGPEQYGFRLNPVEYAEQVRTAYNLTTGRSSGGAELTPVVNSGWRNPERNELVGGVLNSEHQWQETLDLRFPREVQADEIYNSTQPNAAATHWCTMAHSAYLAGARDEIIVENNRNQWVRSNGYRFQYYYRGNSVIDSDPDTYPGTWNDNFNDSRAYVSCTDAVRRRIEQCRDARIAANNSDTDPTNDINPNTTCSPDHIHTSK